jgi:hypothetical protein
VQLTDGVATLELDTDAPGEREGPDAGSRTLAFALYDARLAIPGP